MIAKRALIAIALGLGFLSTTTQVIILRELLVAFTGNELTLATTLAIWLVSIAAGCFIFKHAAQTGKPAFAGLLFIIAAPLVVIQVILIRVLGPLASTFGEIPGPLAVLGLSAACIAPGAVVLGGLFVALVALARKSLEARAIPFIYGYEAMGSAAAGAALSLYLLQAADSFLILAAGGLLSVICGGYLSARARPPARLGGRIALGAAVVVIVGTAAFSRQIDLSTRQIQWSPLHLVASIESRYGNIVVTSRDGTYDFFESGNLSHTIPDLMYAEESAHVPLLYHPAPELILVIGGAGSGIIGEVAKHPTVKEIDFVELDPEVINLTGTYAPPGWLEGPAGIVVRPIFGDARKYVAFTERTYDVVLLSTGVPVTLQTSRYYTVEFFREVTRVLEADGILAFKVPSGGAYMGGELGALLSSLKNTAEEVYREVTLLPGDYVHVLASPTLPVGSLTDSLPAALARRRIHASFVNEYRLFDRLSPLRRAQLDSVAAVYDTGTVNSDARPVSISYAVARWAKHFESGRLLSAMVGSVTEGRCLAGLLISAMLVVPLLMRVAGSPWKTLSGSLAMYAMGLTTMFTQILIIMGFQMVSGYVYGWIAALIAAFMVGMGLASSIAGSRGTPYRQSHLAGLMTGLIALPLASLLILRYAGTLGAGAASHVADLSFIALALASGFLGGTMFAVASAYVAAMGRGVVEAGALAYSLDLVGATVAGFGTGFLMIPSLGIAGSAYAVAATNGVLLATILIWHAFALKSPG